MSSSSSHAMITYTSVSTDMPADASPTTCSPGYIADSKPIEDDLEEDPEMDPVDYPSNEEEEEDDPSALTYPASPVPDSVPSSKEIEPFETDEARKTIRPQLPLPASTKALIAEYGSAPTPPSPPSFPLSLLSSPLPLIPSPPLLLP
ncbi:hypothetical protein Tco_0351712 [Tanacetum coccineum]